MPELSSASFSETDGSNNSASPNGFPEGMAPSGVNDSARAVMGALKRFWDRINGAYASAGAANAYTLTPTVALGAYVTGERYSFRASFTNSGAATLNISALGAKTIKKMTTSGKSDVSSGEIQNGAPVTVEYDGTDLVLCTPIPSAVSLGANTFTADQTIQSTDAGAAAGPILVLDRFSASPAASDTLGAIDFKGRDSGAGTETYARVAVNLVDPTAASEDAQILMLTDVAGTLATRVTVGQGIQVGAPTGGDQGVGTINATAIYDDGAQLPPVATTGEVTTGTSTTTAVSPGRAHLHQSACKAWINFDGSGTPTARDSYNVSSITDDGVGQWTINLTTAMANANYCVVATAGATAGNSRFIAEFASTAFTYSRSTTAFRVCVIDGGGSASDAEYVNAAIFGDM